MKSLAHKPVLGMFRMRFIAAAQYRAAAWAGIATQFVWGAMRIMILFAFYEGSTATQPLTLAQVSSYVWLQQAFLALLATWMFDGDLLNSITDGSVAYELCRPVNLYAMWFARTGAGRVGKALLRMGPVLLVAALLPAPFGMSPPVSPAAFFVFLLSLVLSVIIAIALSMFVYTLSFRTLDTLSSRILLVAFGDLLSGLLIPLPLMPDAVQKIINLLPFRYTFDLPLNIYSGAIPITSALPPLLLQLFWAIALVALGAWALHASQKRILVQGG